MQEAMSYLDTVCTEFITMENNMGSSNIFTGLEQPDILIYGLISAGIASNNYVLSIKSFISLRLLSIRLSANLLLLYIRLSVNLHLRSIRL